MIEEIRKFGKASSQGNIWRLWILQYVMTGHTAFNPTKIIREIDKLNQEVHI